MDNKEFVNLMRVVDKIDDEYIDRFEVSKINVASIYKILDKFIKDNNIIGDGKWEVLDRVLDLFENHRLEVSNEEALRDILESYRLSEKVDKVKQLIQEVKSLQYFYNDNYKLYLEECKVRVLKDTLKYRGKEIKVETKLGPNGLDYLLIGSRTVYGLMIKRDGSLEYCYRKDGLNSFVDKILDGDYIDMFIPEYTTGTLFKITEMYDYTELSNESYLKFLYMFGEIKVRSKDLYNILDKISKDKYDFKDLFKVILINYKHVDQNCVIGVLDKIYTIVLNDGCQNLDRINNKLRLLAKLFKRYIDINFRVDTKTKFSRLFSRKLGSLDELITKVGLIRIVEVESCSYGSNFMYFHNETLNFHNGTAVHIDASGLGFILDERNILETDDKDRILKSLRNGKVVLCGSNLLEKGGVE